MMLDFEIKQEVLPVIQVNYEEVKEALQATLDQYTGLIVTEDSLSAAKQEQKNLASMRVKIDNYRNERKRELTKPILQFEEQCKELIGLIAQAEQPIKDGIAVFDNKKREEKKSSALDIIKEAVEEYQLNEKYAARLTVLDEYLKLTASVKAVKAAIDFKALTLADEQKREQEQIDAAIGTIKATVDNANININTKIKYDEYTNMFNQGFPMPMIITRINQMANMIRVAEMPKEEPLAPVEQPKEEPKPVEVAPVEEPKPVEAPVNEIIYEISFKFTGNADKVKKLSQFLKDNGYEYEVLSKGVKEEE